jgi:DNA repair protein RadC
MKIVKEHLEMYGADTLSTLELLAYLLGTHTSQQKALAMAEKLLATYTLSQLQTADWAEITSSAGLSKTQAQRLSIICELARRLASDQPHQQTQMLTTMDAAMLLKPLMMNLDHEELRVILLDNRNAIVANILMYKGTVNSAVLRVAEIFKLAVARNCPSILIAHNHPSSDPTPSHEDLDVTEQIVAAGKLLDIEVLDHLIIGNPRFVSLKQQMMYSENNNKDSKILVKTRKN